MERSCRARMVVANIAAMVCAAMVLGGECDRRDIDFFGLSGSPDGKYHVLYAPKEKSKAFRFFVVAGDADFADPGRALFSDELAEKAASSFLWTGSAFSIPLAFDPDNKHLAYVSESTGNYEIHELDLATMQTRILAPHPAKDDSPSYSPDGKYLAFVSYRSGKGEIWLWDRAADELKPLTHDPADIVNARFVRDKKLVFAHAGNENASIYDLESNQSKPLTGDAEEVSFDSTHGLIVSAKLSAMGDNFNRLFLDDVANGTSRDLGFRGELAGLSVPVSPDGKWVLAASKEAVQVLPAAGGAPLMFALPGGLSRNANIFLAWMPDGKGFRVFASNAQFTADLADPARSLTPRDKYALSLLALSALAQGHDGDFAAKAGGLEALPDPLRQNDDQKNAIALTKVIRAYTAGQYAPAAEIWKDSGDAEERELALYLGLMDKTPEEFRAGRKAFLARSGEAEAGARDLVKKTDFVDTLDDRQLKAMMKYLKPLLAERLDVMACNFCDSCGRKLSPGSKKITSYLKLHPDSPLSGYLSLTLAEVAREYRQPADAEKYYRLAAKVPEDRLESLVRLADLYRCDCAGGKKDPQAELQVNETIIAEFQGTDEAKQARERAGQYWIGKGDDDKAYALLAPLTLDSDSAALWQESRKNSEPMFKELVLARFAPEPKLTLDHLARAIDLAPADKPDQMLLNLSEKNSNDLIDEHIGDKTAGEPAKLEKILVYSIRHDPEVMEHVPVHDYFCGLRRGEKGADIEGRWDGYAQAHPDLAKSYSFLLLKGLLEYDRHNYREARAQFERALAALGNQPDQSAKAKDMTGQLILICLARENDKALLQKLPATAEQESRKNLDVYGHTLTANLTKRPLAEISEFYLAYRALAGGERPTDYQLLECRASEDDLKKAGRDFSAKYPQSPLAAAVLFALDDYDAVIARFPESFAAYRAMQIKAMEYEGNANYWLAAGTWEKMLRHPQLRKEDKAEILMALGEYELDHTHDYQKAQELLDRAARENPRREIRQGIMLDQARAWYELKDPGQARQTLDRFTREFPDAKDDKLDELKRALSQQ